MNLLVYIAYVVLLAGFLILAGFAVFHAFKYSYISPRMKPIALIFILVSAVLITASLFLVGSLRM